MMNAERQDAARLIRRMIDGCDKESTGDHAWRKCPHCLACHAAQVGDPFAIRLLRIAVEILENPQLPGARNRLKR